VYMTKVWELAKQEPDQEVEKTMPQDKSVPQKKTLVLGILLRDILEAGV